MTASTLHRVLNRALRRARALRLHSLAPTTVACVVCGAAAVSLRACEGCGALVGYAPARSALSLLPDPRRADPLARANTTSTHERAHLHCRCPGHDGTALDPEALSTWIELGCPLHDRKALDRGIASRALDGILGPLDHGALDGSDLDLDDDLDDDLDADLDDTEAA